MRIQFAFKQNPEWKRSLKYYSLPYPELGEHDEWLPYIIDMICSWNSLSCCFCSSSYFIYFFYSSINSWSLFCYTPITSLTMLVIVSIILSSLVFFLLPLISGLSEVFWASEDDCVSVGISLGDGDNEWSTISSSTSSCPSLLVNSFWFFSSALWT